MKRPTVVLLGAPGTGKSRLAVALSHALQASGREAEVVVADTATPGCGPAGDALTLLMGLDTPSEQQQAADASLRTALSRAGAPYHVIYGQAAERLALALGALESRFPSAGKPPGLKPGAAASRPWVWVCDKCSDPHCEHRLLTDLLARRSEGP